MNRSLLYGLLLSVPPAVAAGSGVYLLAGRPTIALAFGVGLGVVVFTLVVLGSEYGSTDRPAGSGR
jgi:threonine/homoserine efflux transporter RhtA